MCMGSGVVVKVRKLVRAIGGGRSGLHEMSRAPHGCPHKTSETVEKKVIKARRRCGSLCTSTSPDQELKKEPKKELLSASTYVILGAAMD